MQKLLKLKYMNILGETSSAPISETTTKPAHTKHHTGDSTSFIVIASVALAVVTVVMKKKATHNLLQNSIRQKNIRR